MQHFGSNAKCMARYLKAHFILSFILPYLEQQPLHDRIDFKLDWFDMTVNSKGYKNREVTAIDLPDFLCPSADGRPGTYTTDYFVITDIHDGNYCSEVEGGPQLTTQKRNREKLAGMLGDYSDPIRKVTDGVSKTIMFVESAGRPNLYNQNKSLVGTMYDAPNTCARGRARPLVRRP